MTGTDAHAARSPLHRLGRNLRNPFALSYLALCAVLLLWAIAVNIPDDSDGAMAFVVPLMATAPASLRPTPAAGRRLDVDRRGRPRGAGQRVDHRLVRPCADRRQPPGRDALTVRGQLGPQAPP
ncbi:SCO4225 family membrane protein [Streptomyces sp. L7]